MNENLTWIVYDLDESGSMGDIKSDTIGAFNDFNREQKLVEGEAKCFLTKFNTKIEKVYEGIAISDIPLLTTDNYKPSTYTRLYDSIGHTINDIKARIKALPDDQKPGKVLFIILTDGLENRSTDFNRTQVFEKIAKREKKGWTFIYLGANQDAMQEGGKIGINKFNTVTWDASPEGVKTAFMSASNYTKKYRMAKTSAELSSLDLNQEYKDAQNNV
jgi:hypothetical protein